MLQFWHLKFRLFQLLQTFQLLHGIYFCVFSLSHLRGGVSCHPCELGLGINHRKTPSAASPVTSFGTQRKQAECRATVLSRQDTTEYMNVWSLISAAGTEQLCPLLHLCGRPEGSLPEYCADHPGEYSFYYWFTSQVRKDKTHNSSVNYKGVAVWIKLIYKCLLFISIFSFSFSSNLFFWLFSPWYHIKPLFELQQLFLMIFT